MIARLVDFVKHDIWRIRVDKLPRLKSFFVRQFRVIILAVRGFDEDRCKLWASALTFYSLLAIVPVVATIFGIAGGFGFEKKLEYHLLERFQGQERVIEEVITYAHNLLAKTSGGLIAGVGVVILFWSTVKVLGSIENSFNHIWGVKKGRPWGRKFSDYLSFMLISPVLLVISSSMTVFVSSRIELLSAKLSAIGGVETLIMVLLKCAPFLVMWVLFTFVYFWMPNTRVRFGSSLVAGVIAGTVFQLVQWAYVIFQIGVAKYSAIYGSLAALPLFLIWLQISWVIVLFGAEISFARQNVQRYEFEQDCRSVSHSFRMLLSLTMTHLLVKNFCAGEKPSSATHISRALDMPIRLAREILFELTEAEVLTEIKGPEEKQVSYQPARDVAGLTVKYVIDALESQGASTVPIAESEGLTKLKECVSQFGELISKSPANVSLKEI